MKALETNETKKEFVEYEEVWSIPSGKKSNPLIGFHAFSFVECDRS
jgi:hypothetical protein